MTTLTPTHPRADRTRRPVLLILILLVAVTALMAPPLWWITNNPFHRSPFDRALWRTSGAGKDAPRSRMALDLIRNHLPKGMRGEAVVRLLGRPDEDMDRAQAAQSLGCRDRHFQAETREVYAYTIGTWSGFKQPNDRLVIELDASGRLVKAWIVKHWS